MTYARSVRSFIETRDDRLMRRLHHWQAPRWIRVWMIVATRLGDGWLWYGLGIALLIAGGSKQLAAVESAGAAALTGVLLYVSLKRVFRRRRPCDIEPHCWARVLPPDQFSFPSGHAISAFSVAIALSACYPAFLIPLLFAALSISVSRIVLGMHFLSDVIAGVSIGSVLGVLFFRAFH
ncbi:MAG TPA: phosphatase PAP2 family protein [Candidatus Acidoferrum sp.]|nr:phosphatase PAP2 family protein [Candidatus Acidoferrum sp.]